MPLPQKRHVLAPRVGQAPTSFVFVVEVCIGGQRRSKSPRRHDHCRSLNESLPDDEGRSPGDRSPSEALVASVVSNHVSPIRACLRFLRLGPVICVERAHHATEKKNGSGRASATANSCSVFGAVACPNRPTTVSVAELDVPPPGAGLETVMVRCPRLSMSLFEICALS